MIAHHLDEDRLDETETTLDVDTQHHTYLGAPGIRSEAFSQQVADNIGLTFTHTPPQSDQGKNILIKGNQAVIFLSNHKELLQQPLSPAENLLVEKGLLYIASDGKLYFTPKALQYYVSQAVIKLGEPESLLMKNVNPFGFHCIDGRVKMPHNLVALPLEEKLMKFPGSIPGGGAGMMLNVLSTLIDVFGKDSEETVEKVAYALLEENKRRNPDNYKIQRHSDKHCDEHHSDHGADDEFSCGCGFLMKAKAKPESFGLTPWAIDFVIELLNNPTWSDLPDILGKDDAYLEEHKERAAILALGIDGGQSANENYVINKQIDFSPFFSEEELNTLSPAEGQEMKQMAFTGNFRAFAVKGAQIASRLEDLIVENTEFLRNVQLSQEQKVWLGSKRLYFAPQYDKKMAGNALHAIMSNKLNTKIQEMTNVIKSKLSSNSPVVTIDIDPITGYPVITDLQVTA